MECARLENLPEARPLDAQFLPARQRWPGDRTEDAGVIDRGGQELGLLTSRRPTRVGHGADRQQPDELVPGEDRGRRDDVDVRGAERLARLLRLGSPGSAPPTGHSRATEQVCRQVVGEAISAAAHATVRVVGRQFLQAALDRHLGDRHEVGVGPAGELAHDGLCRLLRDRRQRQRRQGGDHAGTNGELALEDVRPGRLGPEMGPNACDELGGLDRLDEEVVGAGLEPGDETEAVTRPGHQDDRQGRGLRPSARR